MGVSRGDVDRMNNESLAGRLNPATSRGLSERDGASRKSLRLSAAEAKTNPARATYFYSHVIKILLLSVKAGVFFFLMSFLKYDFA